MLTNPETSTDFFPKIILFDGVCNLCNGIVKFIIRFDSNAKFKFSSLQSGYAQKLLSSAAEIKTADSVIYLRDGLIHMRSNAALYILKDLGGFWKVFTLFFILPRFIRDFLYNIIAKYRYRIFGKRESCMVPTPEIERRFL